MSEQKFEHLEIEMPKSMGGTIDGNYAVISLNRPDKLNALAPQTCKEMAEALEPMEMEKGIRAVVLRGTKNITKKAAFSAGADLSAPLDKRLKMNIPMDFCHGIDIRHRYYFRIEEFTKPLIAAVDGYAFGGGCELALVCDIIIASKRSFFGFPEIKRGIFPSNGGCVRMLRNIGLQRAMKMLYFGERISAEQGLDWGLVSFIAEEGDEFENLVHVKASWLGEQATTSLMMIKKSAKFGGQVPIPIGYHFETLGAGVMTGSKDVQEGITAFLQKREPKFKGF